MDNELELKGMYEVSSRNPNTIYVQFVGEAEHVPPTFIRRFLVAFTYYHLTTEADVTADIMALDI